jgi:dTMP kinase
MVGEPGRFISFEGPEGSGKSTQIVALQAALAAAGIRARTTREPGGTAIGEAIRSVLLRPDACAMLGTTEALLMTASRAQHAGEVIAPTLAAGEWVLCDRYADSTLAYQGGGRGMNHDDLLSLQRIAVGTVWPDLTILLDLPVRVGLARRFGGDQETNRLDAEPVAFHEAVRQRYLDLAAAEPGRWVVIDASRPADHVRFDVAAAVAGRFGLKLVAAETEPTPCG